MMGAKILRRPVSHARRRRPRPRHRDAVAGLGDRGRDRSGSRLPDRSQSRPARHRGRIETPRQRARHRGGADVPADMAVDLARHQAEAGERRGTRVAGMVAGEQHRRAGVATPTANRRGSPAAGRRRTAWADCGEQCLATSCHPILARTGQARILSRRRREGSSLDRPQPDPSALLRRLFEAALAASSAATTLPPHLPPPPRGRTLVVGAGKAAAATARRSRIVAGRRSGLVVTRYGHGVACRRIEIVEAGHPVPDAAGSDAARRILDGAGKGRALDLVAAVRCSGGASSAAHRAGAGGQPAEEQAMTRALLRSGATIGEINCRCRKHLSAIKASTSCCGRRA